MKASAAMPVADSAVEDDEDADDEDDCRCANGLTRRGLPARGVKALTPLEPTAVRELTPRGC